MLDKRGNNGEAHEFSSLKEPRICFSCAVYWQICQESGGQETLSGSSVHAKTCHYVQVLYPLECKTRNHGEYATRFTLHERVSREEKPAVRPINIDRSALPLLL